MSTTPFPPFSSIQSVSTWAKIFIIVGILFMVLDSVSLLLETNLLSSIIHDESSVTKEQMDANNFRVSVITLSTSIIRVLAIILFFIWFYKSYRNLGSLGGRELQSSPRRAVIDFFIPILSLYKPYRATVQIWKVSDPSKNITDNELRRQMDTPLLIQFWWAFWIITNIIGVVVLRILPYTMSANTPDQIIGIDYFQIFVYIPNIICDLLTFFLIKEITTRQEKKSGISI